MESYQPCPGGRSDVPWSEFDAVVVRSTWDYWNDIPAFLDTLKQIDRETRLANPLDVMHWNLEKTYLRDLEGKGIGYRSYDLAGVRARADLFPGFFSALASDELVIKPVIGANGGCVSRGVDG